MIRRFEYACHRTLKPGLVQGFFRLGFGVTLLRDVSLLNYACPQNEELLEAAFSASITLFGGKTLLIDAEPDQRESVIHGRILTPALSPPEEFCVREVTGLFIDTAPYLTWLEREGYPLSVVRKHLNGARS